MKQLPIMCAAILCLVIVMVPVSAITPAQCVIDTSSPFDGLPVSGDGIVPNYVSECVNPTCDDLGFSHEFKVDPPDAGVYPFGSSSVTVSRDGDFFDWSSTLGMDAVIAKGGSHANAYLYDPADTADTGLAAPADCGDGDVQCGLSHISFCYDCACDDGNRCTTDTCDLVGACVFTPVQDCDPGIPTPEFPTLALPVALIIGFLGAVLFIQETGKQ